MTRCAALLGGIGPLVCIEVGVHVGHVFHGTSVPQVFDTEDMG